MTSRRGATSPAVLAEAGGIGQLDEAAVALLTDGARNALKYLDVLDGDPEPSRSKVAGPLRLALLDAGRVLGGGGQGRRPGGEGRRCSARCATSTATCCRPSRASDDGVVLFLTTSAAVGENGLLLGLGCDERAGA